MFSNKSLKKTKFSYNKVKIHSNLTFKIGFARSLNKILYKLLFAYFDVKYSTATLVITMMKTMSILHQIFLRAFRNLNLLYLASDSRCFFKNRQMTSIVDISYHAKINSFREAMPYYEVLRPETKFSLRSLIKITYFLQA